VTADDKSKLAGEADPELTAKVEGTVGDDTVSFTLARAEGDEPGEYAITPTGEAEQGNYVVTYEAGKSLRLVVCSEASTYAQTYFEVSKVSGMDCSFYNRNDNYEAFATTVSWGTNSYAPLAHFGLLVEPTFYTGTVTDGIDPVAGAVVTLTSADEDDVQYTGTTAEDGTFQIAVIQDKKPAKRSTPIVPPGAVSAKHFAQHCTACQLCVAKCPNGVLRPSSDPMRLMQPELSFERGACRPECVECSTVCPTGAIKPITVAQKSSTMIGHAVWVKANCIVLNDGVACGNCARHCPAGAIMMVPSDPDDDTSPMVSAVNTAMCIGCGTCEYVCPSRPFSAIYVEGHEIHNEI
jgi:ferredoxin